MTTQHTVESLMATANEAANYLLTLGPDSTYYKDSVTYLSKSLTEVFDSLASKDAEIERLQSCGSGAGCLHKESQIESLESKVAESQNWKQSVMLAYGHLWHVNTEPMAPVPLRDPEKASYAARKALMGLLTHEERGQAINQVQAILVPVSGKEHKPTWPDPSSEWPFETPKSEGGT